MNKKSSEFDSEIKRIALLMTVNCVRNTVIEEYHGRGSISQEEMKEFNKEVSDNIYTFLKIMLTGSPEQKSALFEMTGLLYPSNWDEPNLDNNLSVILTDFDTVIKQLKDIRLANG